MVGMGFEMGFSCLRFVGCGRRVGGAVKKTWVGRWEI